MDAHESILELSLEPNDPYRNARLAAGRRARRARADLGLSIDEVVKLVSRKRVKAQDVIEFEDSGDGLWKDRDRLEAALGLSPGELSYSVEQSKDAKGEVIAVCARCATSVRWATHGLRLFDTRLEYSEPCLCNGEWKAGDAVDVAEILISTRLAGVKKLVVVGGSQAIATSLSQVPGLDADVILGRAVLTTTEVEAVKRADLVVLAYGELAHATTAQLKDVRMVRASGRTVLAIAEAILDSR